MHACACVWVFGGVLLGFFGCGERVWPIVFLVLQLFWGLGCGLGVRVLRVACCRVLGQCALGAWFLLILGPLLLFTVVVGLGLGGVGGLVVNCIVGVSIFVLCVFCCGLFF